MRRDDNGGASRDAVEAVRAALRSEPRVDLRRHPLDLSYRDGVLTVEGEVGELAAKKLALERAAAVPGVRSIVDRLRVAPASPMSDGEIRSHVANALLSEPALRACGVGVRQGGSPGALREPPGAGHAVFLSVEGGVVTLDGEVPGLAHKRLAGVITWWVPGVRDVVNGLEVVPPEADGEGEIRDAVLLALEKDPFVDASALRVDARGTSVTLAGAVPSDEQRHMAESDAWAVFGVDRVENRIAVRP